MARSVSRRFFHPQRRTRCGQKSGRWTAGVENLERRDLLSASRFLPNFLVLPQASTSVSGYTPAQVRAAYGFDKVSFGSTAADGRGQTIAIIDAYHDPNLAADLNTFDAQFGIAAPPNLKIVNQNGGTSLPGTDPNQGWEGETALDVEWAHAIAPGANLLLVEANSDSDADLFAAVNYARQQAGVSVISMSWGSDDSLANASNDKSLSNAYLVTPSGHQGITFVASSGDDGHPSFPAESPNVLAVGGTDLYLTSAGAITNETAWTPTTSGGQTWSGGGGVSQEFPGRNVPDVAYNAGIGMAVYNTFGLDTGWVSVGGTSAGAPQWGALVAIADQGRALAGLGMLNSGTQTLTALTAAPAVDFHDITTGSTQFQSAGVGYDLATGRGSPVADAIIPYLATYGNGGGTTLTAPAAPTGLTAQSVSTSQINLSWTASAGATGYNVYQLQNGQAVLIGSVGSGSTSVAINNLTAATTYSFAVAATNAAGSTMSAWVQATTAAPVIIVTAPTGVKATGTSSTMAHVAWGAVPGATGYLVYEWNGAQAVQVASVGAAATSVDIGGQSPGAAEYFYVTAYNANSSASSNWVSIVMPTVAIAPPGNLTATATSSTTAKLTWTPSAGATGYRIYYWNGTQAVLLGTVSGSATSATIQGLTAGSTNYFQVVAYNSSTSAATGWVTLSTPVRSAAMVDSLFAQSSSDDRHPSWLY